MTFLDCFPVYDDDADISVRDMYKIDDVLGEGTFSVVYLAERRDQRDACVAIKVIERKQHHHQQQQQQQQQQQEEEEEEEQIEVAS